MSPYFIHARLIPAILVGLPFWFILYELNQVPQVAAFFAELHAWKLAGNLTAGFIFQYAWAMLVREVAKAHEDRYFKQQKGFPSVYLLMKDAEAFSDDLREKLRTKVQIDFRMELPWGDPGDEGKILDIGKLVLEKVRDVKEVHRHNTWYGFYRNLFAGSILGVVLAVVVLMVGIVLKKQLLTAVGIGFAIVYLIMFAMKKRVIVSNGERFAKQMYYSYLKG